MKRTLFSLLAISCFATQAVAQAAAAEPRSRSRGFILAAPSLTGASIQFDFQDEDESDSGGGLSLALGYGFSSRWALMIEGSASSMDSGDGDYILTHGEIGARYHFANPARRWIPFLDAAVGGRAATQEDVEVCTPICETGDLTFSGAAFSFGGGVMYYATPGLAITGGLKLSVGEFSDIEFRNVTVSGLDTDAFSTRLNIGVAWFPKK